MKSWPLSPERRQVGQHADVLGKQELPDEATMEELLDQLGTSLDLPFVMTTYAVELHPSAAPGDRLLVVVGRVTDMADDDAARVDSLFHQEVQLLEPDS
jgi:hypothetical protein